MRSAWRRYCSGRARTSDFVIVPYRLIVCGFVWALSATGAAAQNGPFLEASGEFSAVTIGQRSTTWRLGRVATGAQEEGRFSWTVAGERQQRADLVDWTAQMFGMRRAGDWTFSGTGGFTPDSHFLYRHSLEGEVARRIAAGLVLHGGYRHIVFPHATVRVAQPSVSYYFPHAEVQARLFVVRNATTAQRSETMLLRGSIEASSRLRFAGGAARGARIFDVAALRDVRGNAWIAYGGVRFLLNPAWTLEVTAGRSHEDPLFSQGTGSVRVRRTLR
jgi:YaiO family outer membrane protein